MKYKLVTLIAMTYVFLAFRPVLRSLTHAFNRETPWDRYGAPVDTITDCKIRAENEGKW